MPSQSEQVDRETVTGGWGGRELMFMSLMGNNIIPSHHWNPFWCQTDKRYMVLIKSFEFYPSSQEYPSLSLNHCKLYA